MSLEQKANSFLNRFPKIKKVIKRVYQRTMYGLSHKIKFEGNIKRITPIDEYEYFFGYYDKSPWNKNERYMLCLRAKCTWKDVSPKEKAEIVLIDMHDNSIKVLDTTSSWNVQQGCMLQWLGPNFDKEIIYNDCIDNKYCSVILNIETMEKRIIYFPIYSVSNDGNFALSLDFSRLYNLRPGYGYYNIKEKTEGVELPNDTCIWKIDLKNGKIKELLKYTDFSNFKPRLEMKENHSVHKVNHIMLSPNGKRFMVLYRWFVGQRKYSRLITCDINGKNMYLLNDDDMVSHCYWKNDKEILAFEHKKNEGNGYYLMKDQTDEYIHCWKDISNDGHPSYSPNGKYVVTDSYPDRARVQSIKVMSNSDSYNEIVRVFSPFKYDNDVRCDLHPRWDRKSKKVCLIAHMRVNEHYML